MSEQWQWVRGQPVAVLALDSYELVNLRAAIEAIGYPWPGDEGHSPLEVLNSGDWVGQLYLKLPDPADLARFRAHIPSPNNTPKGYREAARSRLYPTTGDRG